VTRASAALLLGASSMFANMYATQAILPEIGRDLGASPAAAGLSITVVVAGVALGAWLHGPLSDRIGRWRVMVASASAIVVPTVALGATPNLAVLLLLRALQGLLMPGLLVVAVPYVTERFHGARQGAAMGAYTSSLVFGGLVGRVGTALMADVVGWRLALSLLALPTALGALAMRRWLPVDVPHPHTGRSIGGVVAEHARNPYVLLNAVCAGSTFFGFVGIFTYATYRLTAAPIGLGLSAAGLVYGVWLVGAFVTPITRLAGQIGPQRVLPPLLLISLGGVLLTTVDSLAAIIAGLACMALAMFTVVPACQLLIPRLVSHHRGTATSLHLTIYYAAGGLGAYLPGLVLHRGWDDLAAVCAAAVAFGFACAIPLQRRDLRSTLPGA
jgi:YNFM family putative membrane transporter